MRFSRLLPLLVMLPVFAQDQPLARLDQTALPAAGHQSTLVHVEKAGRYSLQVKSPRGVALELVDRMDGPVTSNGAAGVQDGRIDAILDKGVYKLRLTGHEADNGSAALTVLPFHEVNRPADGSDYPVIKSHQIYQGELKDLERRSYWLYLPERAALQLEVMGRSLNDCRLWRDGVWLDTVQPTRTIREPVAGQPMTHLEFHHILNAGWYLIACYGGEPQAWSSNASANPFYLRRGVTVLGEAGRRSFVVSPFGRESFLVNGRPAFFQLGRKDKRDSLLRVTPWRGEASRFDQYGQTAEIRKDARDPWCVLRPYLRDETNWVTVEAEPGAEMTLVHTPNAAYYYLAEDNGGYAIVSQASLEGDDSIDVTGFLYNQSDKAPPAVQTVSVGEGRPYIRRVNLLGETEVFVLVEAPGKYVVRQAEGGATADYQIRPFFYQDPANQPVVPFSAPGAELDLVRAYYRFTIRPNQKGVLTFSLSRVAEDTSATLDDLVKGGEAAANPAYQPMRDLVWVLPNRDELRKNSNSIVLNRRFGVDTGVAIRQLPLSDLARGFHLTVQPGGTLKLPVRFTEPVAMVIESHPTVSVRTSNGELKSGDPVTTKIKQLTIVNSDTTARSINLRTVPRAELIEPSERPPQADANTYPELSRVKPVYKDYERGQRQHFALEVDEAGLYRLETTGLLATFLWVDTRTRTGLFSANQNGVGRNGLIQQYFKRGSYLVTAQTQGQSMGRAGIHLRKGVLVEGGALSLGLRREVALDADAAVRYSFEIKEAGEYRIDTLGLAGQFVQRLEDAEGWPLIRPDRRAVLQLHLRPGSYSYYSLPEPIESTRLTILEKVEEEKPLVGKGPHPIAFNQTVNHLWRQSEEPDRYHLSVGGPVTARISLSRGMRLEFDDRTVHGGEEWQGVLPMGELELKVSSLDDNDRRPYSFTVQTDQLAPGLTQRVTRFPAELEVRVGEAALIDIFSLGGTDVKARLLNEAGTEVIARNDDAGNDWNFRLSQRLAAGDYKLKLTKVGHGGGETQVSMVRKREQELDPMHLPFELKLELGAEVLDIPFNSGDGFLAVMAEGDARIGFAVLDGNRLLAQDQAGIYLPLEPEQSYQLLAWRLGSGSGPVTIRALATERREVAASGRTKLRAGQGDLILLRDTAQLGWRAVDGAAGWRFSPAVGEPCQPLDGNPFASRAGTGMLVFTGAGKGTLELEPFSLRERGETTFELGSVPISFTIHNPNASPMLIAMRSAGSLIGGMFRDGVNPPEAMGWNDAWLGDAETLLVAVGEGAHTAMVWRTREGSERDRVSVTAQSFKALPTVDFKGSYAGRLEAGEVIPLRLASGEHQLQVLLTAGLAAYQAGKVPLVADRRNAMQSLKADGGLFHVMNSGSAPALFQVVAAASPDAPVWDADAGLEIVNQEAGRLVLAVTDVAPNEWLFVEGAGVKARFLRADGRIAEGDRFAMPSVAQSLKGVLEVQSEPGYLRVWKGTAETRASAFFGQKPIDEQPLAGETIPLGDRAVAYRFQLNEAAFVRLRADAAGVSMLVKDGEAMAYAAGASSQGREIARYLESGSYVLWTRPFQGLPQSGGLSLQIIQPTNLVERDQPEDGHYPPTSLIGPRQCHIYHFSLPQKAVVGVGLSVESDQLDGTLYTMTNDIIARGPYVRRELEPGDYLYVVWGGQLPVQYAPVVFGLSGSRRGVPDEVKRTYLSDGQ